MVPLNGEIPMKMKDLKALALLGMTSALTTSSAVEAKSQLQSFSEEIMCQEVCEQMVFARKCDTCNRTVFANKHKA